MKTTKKLKFVVKREDTGKLARIEIEAENQVFDLLGLSRLPLNFDEDAILYMYREGDDDNVSEVTNLNEIANPQTIWIVKEKKPNKKTIEDEYTVHAMKRGPSKFMMHSGRHAREPTKQEKLLKKLKIQEMSNETEQGEGTLKSYKI